jgi:hypothetical protein
MSGAILPLPLYTIIALPGLTLPLLLPLWLSFYKVIFFLQNDVYAYVPYRGVQDHM